MTAAVPQPLIVGIDVGGTFTDLIAVDGNSLSIAKVPSTPDDPSRAVLDGLAQLCSSLGRDVGDVGLLLHGTTVATNALLQRRGAITGLLTTAGFRDVLEIARQARPRLFAFDAARPAPLVARPLRLEIAERLAPTGQVETPLDEESLRNALAHLRAAGVESVAVSFLHAYANPAHERQAAELIRRLWPEAHVSLSSDVIPEYREYERTSTTVVNAFIAPVMSRYLSSMEASLRAGGLRAPLRVMQSSGGLMTVERACRAPVATLLSGVAAGAIGGARIAQAAGRPLALSIDIGGTSCDLALGIAGEVRTNRRTEVGGLPVRLPSLDVHTIGAGGGSLAYIDAGGALRVGPESAGAQPGPACYGRGGTQSTVSDANLVLGRLPTALIGGALRLSVEAARTAVARIADPLGLDVESAAAGIVRVINASMARQMRVITIESGTDPRDCCLVAFGGGGPVHASDLARDIGIREVIIPPAPGVTSALGLALADAKHDQVQTVLVDMGVAPGERASAAAALEAAYARLTAEALGELAGASAGQAPQIRREAEIRYRRQGHELPVAVPPGPLDASDMDALEEAFHQAHEQRFGYAARGEPVLIVNLLLTASVPAKRGVPRLQASGDRGRSAERRPVWFEDRWHDTPVVGRGQLHHGETHAGPLIVEQLDTTTVVPPWASLARDELDNLIMTIAD